MLLGVTWQSTARTWTPPGCGLPQGLAKDGVCCVIGVKIQYRPHLDNEQGIARAALRHRPLQTPQVLGPPLRGGIRKGADAPILQGNALDLQIALLPVLLEGKVKPGIPVDGLGPQVPDLPQGRPPRSHS